MAHLGTPELGHSLLEIEQQKRLTPNQGMNYNSTYGNPTQVQGFGNVPSFTLPSSQSLMNSGNSIRYNTSGSGSNPFGYLDNVPKSPPGGGLGKYFTADNMDAFGSAIGGLGQLASGWAALKNMGLQRDAYNTMKDQWERNYGDQTTVANNMIADRNAWRNANNMTTTANYVGGQAPGKNYAG